MNLLFPTLEESDIPALTPVMVAAFDDDAQRYLAVEHSGPPGYDDGTFLKKFAIEDPNSIACRVVLENINVGAFIIWWNREGTSYLGNLFIDPGFQGKGIGAATWAYIQNKYPCQKWRLETPKWSERNHVFYEGKCGFHKVGEQYDQYVYEKVMG